MTVVIQDIAYYLPEKVVKNTDLASDYPDWDMQKVEKRSGVIQRHVADSNQTSFDLAFEACQRMLHHQPHLRLEIDGLIFCTQSPDYIMPPNSCLLHKSLELKEEVLSFDINHACSGFVYGMAIARGLLESGQVSKLLLVTAETYSKMIGNGDRSARTLFGDGAAATLLTLGKEGSGIQDIICATAGTGYKSFYIPAGGHRIPATSYTKEEGTDKSGNIRTAEQIHMDGMEILAFVNTRVKSQIASLLEKNNLKVEDIDVFVFHQASNMALDALRRLLRIDRSKVYKNLRNLGNTVSATIPIALKDAQEEGAIKKGDLVLLSGFGVGLSWASALYRF